MNLMTVDDSLPSNFELLHLSYETLVDDEVLWIISQYCYFVWERICYRSMKRTRKAKILLDILLYDQWQYARSMSRMVRFVLSTAVFQISGSMPDLNQKMQSRFAYSLITREI